MNRAKMKKKKIIGYAVCFDDSDGKLDILVDDYKYKIFSSKEEAKGYRAWVDFYKIVKVDIIFKESKE